MDPQRVKVINPNDGWLGTEYYIGENKVNNVRSIDFRVAVDEVPTFTFETSGLPDIDMTGNVKFSFTLETVQQAATVLRNEFKSNGESRKALVASIHSAIAESPDETTTLGLAEKITDRIIGIENEEAK